MKWPSGIEPPGNLKHYSRKELIKKLRHKKRAILAMGASPEAIFKAAVPHISMSGLSKIRIIVLPQHEFELYYGAREELRKKSAPNPLQRSFNEIEEAGLKNMSFRLLPFLLELIAEAWGAPLNS